MFDKAFRLTDELTKVNDGGEFEKAVSEIYPSELELKTHQITRSEKSLFNSDKEIVDKILYLTFYNKHNSSSILFSKSVIFSKEDDIVNLPCIKWT